MSYPATFDVRTPERIDRWRVLVQWILAMPHFVVLYALQGLSCAVAFISWFFILFTGRLPAGLAELQVMILRYGLRTEAYASFLHDQYPPFSFSTSNADPDDTPVTVTYVPVLDDRNRLTVGLRIFWAIPAMLWVILIGIVGGICAFLAFFAVLFTGHWPEGLRSWVVKMFRVSNRFSAYVLLLTDEYPPFESD